MFLYILNITYIALSYEGIKFILWLCTKVALEFLVCIQYKLYALNLKYKKSA